jgi:hypothetical protein
LKMPSFFPSPGKGSLSPQGFHTSTYLVPYAAV